MNRNTIRYRHFYKNRRLVATIATVDMPGDEVAVAAAICRKEDTPLKKHGVAIARARLEQGKFVVIPHDVLRKAIREGTLITTYFVNRSCY